MSTYPPLGASGALLKVERRGLRWCVVSTVLVPLPTDDGWKGIELVLSRHWRSADAWAERMQRLIDGRVL